jgi:galactokinase
MTVTAVAPGRVNLIGDHTDYTGGLVLPMAINQATIVTGKRGGNEVRLTSSEQHEPAVVPLDVSDPFSTKPDWARYVAGVVAILQPKEGFTGSVSSTIPVGSGLSSSAALEVAVAKALGFDGSTLELARLCQRAEQVASGVPCGIMDQLASAGGVAGHALLIDCHTLLIEPIPVPMAVDVVVIHSGQHRALSGSAYAERTAQCSMAEDIVGPLRLVREVSVLDAIDDETIRRRARHVVTENERVRQFAGALKRGDYSHAGELMVESHTSLRVDYNVSTPVLDTLVKRLIDTPGVLGARLTGAGFGGCVVALTGPGALQEGWRVRPAAGASLIAG